MPKYKLTYFKRRGKAEIARFIFAYAGVVYEDKRITEKEWQDLKPSLPTCMLPVLEVDGKMLAGSGPIALYLAREFTLTGYNNFEKAEIYSIMDIVNDLVSDVVPAVFGDDTSKEAARKALNEVHIPKYVGILEKLIGDDGWAYGHQLTVADFSIAIAGDMIFLMFPDQAHHFPKVKKCIDAVKDMPKIHYWINQRPQSEHYCKPEPL